MSSRWTIPGRCGSSPPPSRSPSSSTSVGPRWPGAGWTTRPAGLSTTASRSSAWTMRGSRLTPAGRGSPIALRAERRSSDEHQPTAPAVIAMSARLNAGHSGGSMKSVTAPARTRSARLPSAPPASRPTASHSPGRAGSSGEPDEDQRQGDDRHREHEPPARSPSARTRRPLLAMLVRSKPSDEARRARRRPATRRRSPSPPGRRATTDAADGERPAPAATPGSPRRAHPRIRPTTTPRTIESRMIARIGLRSSAKPRRRSAGGSAGRGSGTGR